MGLSEHVERLQSYDRAYLVQTSIHGLVNDLNDARLPCKAFGRSQLIQAEAARPGSVHSRHYLGPGVWLFGIGGGAERPLTSRMGAQDLYCEAIYLDLGAGAVDYHRSTAARSTALEIVLSDDSR